MKFSHLNVGYDPRRHPQDAMFCAILTFLTAALGTFACLNLIAPLHPHGVAINPLTTWTASGSIVGAQQFNVRLLTSLIVGAIAAFVAGLGAWKNTPLTEPFVQQSNDDPRVYYGEKARRELRLKLFEQAGFKTPRGIYLAPHLPLPRRMELWNFLLIGAPESGKSNITRAIADQAIDRGDRVLLLCNKGDVTSAFNDREAILIAAHHKESCALDLAADISDLGAAMQFAADIVPASNPPFWSNCARDVLTDLILDAMHNQEANWNARTLLDAALQDSQLIRDSIAWIDLNTSPLLQSSDPEGDDRTVAGILLTLRSAVFTNLRPLAWAWDTMPKKRRFSVKRWMSDDYSGPKTVIVQYSPEYKGVSTLVAGSLISSIATRLADPQLAIDPERRVFMILDEFHLLNKINNFASALALGREKGLVAVCGLQYYGQLIEKYGEVEADLLANLFQFKIYGRLPPGDSADLIGKRLGTRFVSALIENRVKTPDNFQKFVEERKTIDTFSGKRLASETGVFTGTDKVSEVRAIVHVYGNCYFLHWPLTIWKSKRKGFIPAPWLTKAPKA